MRRISYSGASFLTTTAVADALLSLVTALGSNQTTETLELPAVNTAGKPMTVKLVVGPRSELISIPEESPWETACTAASLAYLRARTQTLTQPNPLAYYETITDSDWHEIATTT
ncbi:hypothetical protein E3T54_10085 [Cryobacterium sp. Sr8]|uniref:hypothetical protein n=1 Tax=Cryobacterium sp. Sr8 TaxID=1259203 RepID=UPI001068FF6D|nr:hypothetical protein [Cryobacterium sp. Sr8]TFD76736.1 hypothetical protein E3T54_10085 [Cryobacterium sp. Sr8]